MKECVDHTIHDTIRADFSKEGAEYVTYARIRDPVLAIR
jgi:hypothetical protein